MAEESPICRLSGTLAFCLLICGLSATVAQQNVGHCKTFSVYRKPRGGPVMCAVGSAESTQSVKTVADCSRRCTGDAECTSFNYRTGYRDGGQCEMFVRLPLGYNATVGCQHFRKDGVIGKRNKSFILTDWRLYFTGDNTILSVYVDGQRFTNMTNAGNYKQPDLISLPAAPSLFAISIIINNNNSVGGIMASDSDGRITDSSWKCTKNLESGWSQLGFVDSAWPAAVEQNANCDKNTSWTTNNGGRAVVSISARAYWIWPADAPLSSSVTFYCRWKITPKAPMPAYQLSIDAGNVVDEVYFDGIRYPSILTYGSLLGAADTLSWNSIPSLIAIKAHSTGTYNGILASDSAGMLSDRSWKCKGNVPANWTMPGLADASWPNAVVQNANGDLNSKWCTYLPGPITDIRLQANWVWASDSCSTCTTYCRVRLTPPVPPIYQLNVTVDDYLREVYFDGVQYNIASLPNRNMWYIIDTITIGFKPQLIAIRGYSIASPAGILFQDSMGHVSDIDWICSSSWELNWEKPTFDDSTWPEAVNQWANGDPSASGHFMQGISPDAFWIWSKSPSPSDAYCRYYVPI